MGQALLCKRMGKTRVIAETGAGQHGTATAMAAAVMGLKAEIYMGTEDIARQRMNVFRMQLMGAKVHPVDSGSRTLKDALNEAFRDWAATVEDTYYMLGTAAGPHPYPTMVRDFQSVIGKEARRQLLRQEGKLPDLLVACVGGGSNAIGTFHPFLKDEGVGFLGAEAAGEGLHTGKHSASISGGEVGVLHGCKSYLLQDEHGMVRETHSVAAGLDYPGVGPEHSLLKDIGRAEYVGVTDEEALAAFRTLSEVEGIIPALESSHAVHAGMQTGQEDGPGPGRGHHHLRPGGQGPGDGHRAAGGGRHEQAERCVRGGDGPDLLPHRRLPVRAREPRVCHGLRARRGGRSSSWGCRSPTRWPTARSSSTPRRRRWRRGMTPAKVFDLVRELRKRTDVPIVLMGYYNPIFRIGEDAYVRRTQEAGADGLIVPDLPLEESRSLMAAMPPQGRRPGPTGRADHLPEEDDEDRRPQLRLPVPGELDGHHRGEEGAGRGRRGLVARAKRACNGIPLGVGFGVSRPEHVVRLKEAGADAAIVGSAILQDDHRRPAPARSRRSSALSPRGAEPSAFLGK